MANKHTYGDQYGAECPYCGENIRYPWQTSDCVYTVSCEHCGKEVNIISIDISGDVVLGRKSASEEEDGID